jgi:hypothetical protein
MVIDDLSDLLNLHPSPDDRRFLNGPMLATWLKAHHADLKAQLGANYKRVERWAAGDAARWDAADAILTALDCHVHQLPPEMWIEGPAKSRERSSAGLFLEEKTAA